MKRRLAYITAPWEGYPVENAEEAARYCRAVYEAGYAPICPALFLPRFLRDLLRRSHVLVVCGSVVNEGMKNDIAIAQRLGITATTSKLSPKLVIASVIGEVTKEYDQNTSVSLALAVDTVDLVNEKDALAITATGTFADANVGTDKSVTVGALTVDSVDKDWYSVTAPENVTGAITAVRLKGTLEISGDAVPGGTLTAEYTPASGETVSYQWTVGNETDRGGRPTRSRQRTWARRSKSPPRPRTITTPAPSPARPSPLARKARRPRTRPR